MSYDSPQLIAELGTIHDGSFGNALKLIQLVADVGANTAKFQLHIASAETTKDAPNPSYFSDESRYEYFNRIAFTSEQWKDLYQFSKSLNLRFGCSVFSTEALYQILETGVDVVKIPSGEITNIALIKEISRTCEVVHISTGMSTFREIDNALAILENVQDLVVFQCRSQYPVPSEKVGLNMIQEFKARYGLPVGFSDHSKGVEMSISAIALGAIAVEKHLTFSRKMYGSDASNALEPDEFKTLTSEIKNVWIALKNPVNKDDLTGLEEMRRVFQKSIAVKRSLEKGHILSEEDLMFLKPETGIPASQVGSVIGRVLLRSLEEGSLIQESDLL